MASNLTPEQRLDKNGRLVTRHVLAAPHPSSTASGVPAPTLRPVELPEASQGEAMASRLMTVVESSYLSDAARNEVTTLMSEMDETDAKNLFGTLEQEGVLRDSLVEKIGSRRNELTAERFSRWLRRMNDNHTRIYDDYCAEVKRWQKDDYVQPDRSNGSRASISMVDGTEHYAALGLELSVSQENDLMLLTNRIHFKSILNADMASLLASDDDGWQEKDLRIGSMELIRYVIDHPERFDAVLEHVRNPEVTRGVELLHLLKDEGSSSLTSGAL